MKVLYRQTAGDDIVRQFRYYLLSAEAPENPFACGRLSGAPFNHSAKILTWVRDILLAILDFEIFARGPSLDLKRFGFITLWRQTPCTFFVSCTANET